MTKLSKDFDSDEFSCPHCGKNKVAGELVIKLQQLRDIISKAIFITSGYRCQTYNDRIGGALNSAHLIGEGVDIQVKDMLPFVLAYQASEIKGIRLGIYPNHLHMDIRPANPSKYWLVKKYGQKVIYSGKEKNLAKFLKNNL